MFTLDNAAKCDLSELNPSKWMIIWTRKIDANISKVYGCFCRLTSTWLWNLLFFQRNDENKISSMSKKAFSVHVIWLMGHLSFRHAIPFFHQMFNEWNINRPDEMVTRRFQAFIIVSATHKQTPYDMSIQFFM